MNQPNESGAEMRMLGGTPLNCEKCRQPNSAEVRDPRISNLSRDDTAALKAFAEASGMADAMPAWMKREMDEKTAPDDAEVRCPKCGRVPTLIKRLIPKLFACEQCHASLEVILRCGTPEPASEAVEGKEATGFNALAEMAKGTSFGALFDATKDVASLQAQVEQLKRERDELRNILDAGKGQSGVSLLYDIIERRDHQLASLLADVLRLEKEREEEKQRRIAVMSLPRWPTWDQLHKAHDELYLERDALKSRQQQIKKLADDWKDSNRNASILAREIVKLCQ